MTPSSPQADVRLVPVEPTEAMLHAADMKAMFTRGETDMPRALWAAMLAAAPVAPLASNLVGDSQPGDTGVNAPVAPAGSDGEAKLQPATAALVDRFAAALKEKLAAAEVKYGYSDGWLADHWQGQLVTKLVDHVQKGDPRDVAAFCAFAWHHGWSITPAAPVAPAGSDDAKLLAYEDAHETAVSMGYPSITEALEALAARAQPPAGSLDFERDGDKIILPRITTAELCARMGWYAGYESAMAGPEGKCFDQAFAEMDIVKALAHPTEPAAPPVGEVREMVAAAINGLRTDDDERYGTLVNSVLDDALKAALSALGGAE